MIDQRGRVVLVTGGARRVGRAISLLLAGRGAVLCVHYRSSRDAAEELVSEIRGRGGVADAWQADLTCTADCTALRDRILAAHGRLDVLVNNAAAFERAGIGDGEDAAWERAFETSLRTNVMAPVRLSRLFRETLSVNNGAVVNLLDIGGLVAWPEYALHGISKGALVHATRVLARALGPSVRVNGVAPGIALFPDDMDESRRQALLAKTALGCPGNAEQVAENCRVCGRSRIHDGDGDSCGWRLVCPRMKIDDCFSNRRDGPCAFGSCAL